MRVFECVPNVSEGRDAAIVDACARAIEDAGATLAHRTSDAVHHRSVFTFFGERDVVLAAALALARVACERIDLREHRGAHPRIGALDVLPFVPFGSATAEDAVALARESAEHLWATLRVPSYLYADAATSDERRLLANVRAGGFEGLRARADRPDVGDEPHERAGAVAVGARAPLVAFNVVLATGDVHLARAIARRLRERDGGLRTVRALGIRLADDRVQVSCNLTDPAAVPLHRVLEIVRSLAARAGVNVAGSELIGLVPRDALAALVAHRFGFEVRPREAENSDA
jgi:glutamate formiminotransferase